MKDWKTTTLGILAALAGLINLLIKILKGEPITINDILIVIGAFGAGGGLYVASDSSNVKKLGEAMKKKGLILIALCLVPFLVGGCSTPWQNTMTSSVLTTGQLATVSEQTVQATCSLGQLPADKCLSLCQTYLKIRASYIVAENTAKLTLYLPTSQQQASLAQLQAMLSDLGVSIQNLIKEFQSVQAGVKAGTYKISPALLSLIIQAIEALIADFPNIVNAISHFGQGTVDINALAKQLDDSVATLPVWVCK